MKKDKVVILRGARLIALYRFCFLHGKKEIETCATQDHGKNFAKKFIKILERIAFSNAKVKIVDTIDDICQACRKEKTRGCRELIQYGISATAADRGIIHFYGFKVGKTYSAKYILRRLKEKGSCE